MTRTSKRPSYKLEDVKKLIRDNNIFINSNAQEDAWDDFNWKLDDIRKCLLKLKIGHFYKTEPHKNNAELMIDIYKAKNIMKDINIYVHFYIIPGGNLIINSFKEL